MDEALLILPLDDVPLQRWLPSVGTTATKVEWMEEELTPQTDVIATSADTASPWTVVVSDTNRFRVGDLLHIQGDLETNLYLVDSITNATTFELSSFGTTTNSDDPAADDVLEIVGQLRDEGGAPPDARSVERDDLYNYTQVVQEKVEASRSARKEAKYALADVYDHEVEKKFRELAIRFERALMSGVRYKSGKKRSMGGFFYFFLNGDSEGSAQSRSGNAASSKATLNALLKDAWEAGGTPTTLFVAPNVKAAISANVDAALRRSARTERQAGFVVDEFISDFGTIDIIPNRYIPSKKGLLLQRDFNPRRPFDGIFHEMLAKTVDGDQGQIVGETSLEVKNRTAQGILTITDA